MCHTVEQRTNSILNIRTVHLIAYNTFMTIIIFLQTHSVHKRKKQNHQQEKKELISHLLKDKFYFCSKIFVKNIQENDEYT